ncbi:hypothetical protein F5B20DRAFT_522690 [Whalleya microplaca]|nr:hypothetical protein F5B20DRAFT_522690 [Whalleya microplaca]
MFGSNAGLRGGPKLASCGYLRACIDEALRMSLGSLTHCGKNCTKTSDISHSLLTGILSHQAQK